MQIQYSLRNALRSGQPSQWHLWLAHAETNAKNRMQTSTKLAQIPSSESIFVPSGPFPEDRKGWIGRQAQAGAASHRPRSRSVDVCADAGNWCSLERHKVAMVRRCKLLLSSVTETRSPHRRSIVAVLGQDCNGCVGFNEFACVWFLKREISKTSVLASEVGQISLIT